MLRAFKAFLSFSFCLTLIACGGVDGSQSSGSAGSDAKTIVASHSVVSTDYHLIVQQLYIAYFGRPADPSGLENFAAELALSHAPTDVQALNAAYGSNIAIRGLVDAFGTSEESRALYPGDTRSFIAAIYRNVLNRSPDNEGLDFWVDAVERRGLTRAHASFSILAGALANPTAQGRVDAMLINRRVAAGSEFTAALNRAGLASAYRGNAAATAARNMLSSVTGTTDDRAIQAAIESTLNELRRAEASQGATPPVAAPQPSFTAAATVAPEDGATLSGVVRMEVRGSGIQNVELLPGTGYVPIHQRGTVSDDRTAAIIEFDTRSVPDGPLTVRIAAFSAAPGQGGSEITAMAARTWTIRNTSAPDFSAVLSAAPWQGDRYPTDYTLTFAVNGTGLGNVELVSANDPNIVYGRFEISPDRTFARLRFQPITSPIIYGSYHVRILAWDVPPGQSGRMIEVMPARTYLMHLPLGCWTYVPNCGDPAP